jgi:hypothetical protein
MYKDKNDPLKGLSSPLWKKHYNASDEAIILHLAKDLDLAIEKHLCNTGGPFILDQENCYIKYLLIDIKISRRDCKAFKIVTTGGPLLLRFLLVRISN